MTAMTFARRRVLLANAHHAGRRWRDLAQLLLVALAVTAVLLALPIHSKGVAVGFVLGAVLLVACLSIERFEDPQVLGSLAEQGTIGALTKVRGWRVIENLPFDGVDVDHVVVTPSGVLAVETKYHGRTYPEAASRRMESDLAAATAAARKVRLFLRSRNVNAALDVKPVLAVWGPGSPDLPNGFRWAGDVLVADPAHPELWSHLFAAPLLGAPARDQAHAALAEYAEVRRRHEEEQFGRMRRRLWHEFRSGVAAERAERKNRRDVRRRSRTRHAHQSA
jgi:hypothetical protein